MVEGRMGVEINGMGLLSPLGKGWEAVKAAKGIQGNTTCPLAREDYGVTGELDEKGWRATLLAIAASRMALDQAYPAGVGPNPETGVIIGTSLMNLGALERYLHSFKRSGPEAVPPWALHYGLPLAHASHITVSLKLKGMCETLNDPVTAGISAIGMGYRAIAFGEESCLLVGGVDSPSGSIFKYLQDKHPYSGAVEGCAVFHIRGCDPERASVSGQAFICGYTKAFCRGEEDRDLIRSLAEEAFPDGRGVDLLLDAAAIPGPFPLMLAAGPALSCGLAVSLLDRPLPPYLKKIQPSWAFLRHQDSVHRVIVTAQSPVGERAVLAISSQQGLSKTVKPVCRIQSAPGRKGWDTRAVITGMGTASAIGLGSAAFCRELIKGRSGVVTYTPPGGGSPVTAALVGDLPEVPGLRRSTQLTMAAAEEALLDSGLTNEVVSGIYLGETLTSVESWVHLAGLFRHKDGQIPPGTMESTYESTASAVAKSFGFYGETSTFASGCTGGLFALGRAARDAASGVRPVFLAGGVDSNLFPLALGILSQAKLLTACQDPQKAGRPFDRDRDGEVTGEGCALFVVENPERAAKRGAVPYACISGFGTAGEGHHFKYNKPDGEAVLTAAEAALHRAGLKAEDIGLVIAHASGFMGSDAIEVKALAALFSRCTRLPPVVSIKGATGQPFSAGGPLQVAAALCALKTGVIPPTAHFSTADEGDPFDHVHAARKSEVPLRHVLVLSYGYGGGKAALVLSAYGES